MTRALQTRTTVRPNGVLELRDASLPAGAIVDVIVLYETPDPARERTGSFLDVAESLNLAGPRDWSERLEDYLYGKEKH